MLTRIQILCIVVLVLAQAQALARPWQFTDAATVRTITDVRIAPNGASVLVGFNHADLRRNAYLSQYEALAIGGRSTPSIVSADLSNPRWSPDSRAVAWLSASNAATIVLTGPAGKHRRRLHLAGPVVAFSWSPDGKELAAIQTSPTARANARLRSITTESDLFGDLPPTRSIWIIEAASGRERRLTSGRWSYGGSSTDHDPAWSPDGSELAVVRQPDSLNGSYEHAQYVTINLRSGAVSPIVRQPFFAYPRSPAPLFGASGALAYVKTWDGKLASREDVYVDGRDVDAPLDRDVWSCANGAIAWQGTHVLALLMDGVSMRIYRAGIGEMPRALTPSTGSVEGFSVAQTGRIAYIWSTPTRESAVELLDSDGRTREIVPPPPLPAGLTMPRARLVHWRDGAGHTLVGQLTLPNGDDLRRAPLVVELHGGPQCADDYSFQNYDVPLAQIFASHGFAYFRPSPRGSDGYGDWSYKSIVGDWGPGPMRDVMRGIDAVYRSGVGDPAHTFVEGASYGGYLTAWIVTHSSRFRAAVVEVPATDMMLDASLGDSPNIDRRFFGPEPLLRLGLLAQQSPASYADAMNTPLLLLAGAKDANTSDVQPIVFYKLLAARGKPVTMLLDSQAGHWPDDPVGNNLWWRAAYNWFTSHLR